jgi:hypothetical protein
MGKREHPLADGNPGEDAIGEMRGSVRHAPSAAGGAEAAALAREGDQTLELAVVATQAKESVCKDATARERAQLLLDEARDRSIALACKESGELCIDRLVEQGFFGFVPQIPGGRMSARRVGFGTCSARRGRAHLAIEVRSACCGLPPQNTSTRGREDRSSRTQTGPFTDRPSTLSRATPELVQPGQCVRRSAARLHCR